MPAELKDPAQRIPLTRGLFALVDAEDYERLKRWKWQAHPMHNTTYAKRWNGATNKHVYMHREILGFPSVVDHVNGNGLDNRRSNIRPASYHGNNCNRRKNRNSKGKFKGVRWRPRFNQFAAEIKFNGRSYHIGHYRNEEDAAIAYNVAAQIFFGSFAYLNPV